jgi:hypothetical protein
MLERLTKNNSLAYLKIVNYDCKKFYRIGPEMRFLVSQLTVAKEHYSIIGAETTVPTTFFQTNRVTFNITNWFQA